MRTDLALAFASAVVAFVINLLSYWSLSNAAGAAILTFSLCITLFWVLHGLRRAFGK